MSTVPARRAARQRLILHGVNWHSYSRFLRAFGAKTTPVDEAVAITLNWYRTNR